MERPVILVTSATDIATALRRDRERKKKMIGEEFDDYVGWADRYTAKAENPDALWGKTLIRVEMHADLWLQALGYHLVIMDRKEAERRSMDVVRGAPVSEDPIHPMTPVRTFALSYFR